MKGLILGLFCVISIYVLHASGGDVIHLVPAHFFCPIDKTDHDILIPDPTDCKIYYKCSNNFTVPESCPDGLEWCVQLSLCTIPLLSNCIINKTTIQYTSAELVTYRPPVLQCDDGTNNGNFSIGPSTTKEVCPVNGALSVDVSNSVFYYECVNNEPVRRTCADGEKFDPWEQKCIQSTVSNYITAGFCSIPDIVVPDIYDCRTFYICYQGVIKAKICPYGLSFNKWFGICFLPSYAYCTPFEEITSTETTTTEITTPFSPPGPSCAINEYSCPTEDYTLPDDSDCTSYWICKSGVPQKQSCPTGQSFSPWAHQCVSKDDSLCSNSVTFGSYCSSTQDRIPMGDNPIYFWECFDYSVRQRECINNTSYNPWTKRCSVSTCGYLTTIQPQTPPPPICQTTLQSISNVDNCKSFYSCSSGTPSKYECPTGLLWNCFLGFCAPSVFPNCCPNDPNIDKYTKISTCSNNGFKIPDPMTCNRYFECVSNTIILNSCSDTEIFDFKTSSCRPDIDGVCSDLTTLSPTTSSCAAIQNSCSIEGLTHPSSDCTSYWICLNGTPQKQFCSTGETFSPWEHKCVPENYTTCASAISYGNYCPSAQDRIIIYGNDSYFWECYNYAVRDRHCLPGYAFNPWTKRCIDCSTSVTTTPLSSQTTYTDGCNAGSCDTTTELACQIDRNICSIEGLTQPSSDCTSYWVCQNGTPQKEFCATGETFDPWNHKCILQNDTLCASNIKYGDNCPSTQDRIMIDGNETYFWECFNYNVRDRHCLPGYTFNQWTKRCVDCSNSQTTETSSYPQSDSTPVCTDSSCETSTQSTCQVDRTTCNIENLTHPTTDCTSYWICLNSQPQKQSCEATETFSPWEHKCIPKNDAVCASTIKYGDSCPSAQDRIMIDGNDTYFWECYNYSVRDRHCLPGYIFNQWTKRCVDCSGSVVTTTTPGSLQTDTSPVCTDASCDTTSTEPTTVQTSTTTESTCQVDKTTCSIQNLTHPSTDCTSYWICLNSQPQKLSCADGETFSPWEHKCVPKNDAVCASTIKYGDSCPSAQDRIMIDGNDTYFWECYNYSVRDRNCVPGYIFNQWTKRCVACSGSVVTTSTPVSLRTDTSPICTDASCDTTSTEPTTAQTSTTTTESTCQVDKTTCSIQNLTHPSTDCTSYWICLNSQPQKLSCGDGETFSPWEHKCIPKNDAVCASTIKYGDSCPSAQDRIMIDGNDTYFWECYNYSVRDRNCVPGYIFNQWTKRCVACSGSVVTTTTLVSLRTDTSPICTDASCDTTSTEQTTAQTSTTTESTCQVDKTICSIENLTHPSTDCTSYWICLNSQPQKLSCADGETFSPWEHKCIPKNDAVCASTIKYGDSCPSAQDRIMIDGNDTYFWECYNYSVRDRNCVPGYIFNQWTKRCVACSTSTSTSTTTSVSTDTTIVGSVDSTTIDSFDSTTKNSDESTTGESNDSTTAKGGCEGSADCNSNSETTSTSTSESTTSASTTSTTPAIGSCEGNGDCGSNNNPTKITSEATSESTITSTEPTIAQTSTTPTETTTTTTEAATSTTGATTTTTKATETTTTTSEAPITTTAATTSTTAATTTTTAATTTTTKATETTKTTTAAPKTTTAATTSTTVPTTTTTKTTSKTNMPTMHSGGGGCGGSHGGC